MSIQVANQISQELEPRRFNVAEYRKMREVGILENVEQFELLNGEIWEKYTSARRRFTVSEYYKMAEVGILKDDERLELIHGKIIKMSPFGNLHRACVNRLNSLLNRIPEYAYILSIQNSIGLEGNMTEPQPDIALLKYRKDFYKKQKPMPKDVQLIMEVSDTTFNYDRNIKWRIYAEAGIPEYWIIDLKEERILVFTQPVGSEYLASKEFRPGEIAVSFTIPSVSLSVSEMLNLDE